jgi:hypothetical protein
MHLNTPKPPPPPTCKILQPLPERDIDYSPSTPFMSELVEESPHDKTGQPVTVKTVLFDSSLFLEQDCWFKLFQDDGREMTSNKLAIYHNLPKGKPTRKYRLIAHG